MFDPDAPPLEPPYAEAPTLDALASAWSAALTVEAGPDSSLRVPTVINPNDATVADAPRAAPASAEDGAPLPVLPERRLRAAPDESDAPNASTAAEPPPDLEIGAVLGRGGMGVVLSARQTALNRRVAVKAMLPEQAASVDARRKFIAEAVVTGGLDHPNIVPVHELALSEDRLPYYTMTEVRGQPWKAFLRARTEDENLDILLRVCDAVAFAHERGVLHRDIKPENVMVGGHGETLLMDWGIAVAFGDRLVHATPLSDQNARAGTPAYMAPEMAAGRADLIGVASDVYLLGAVLYEIAAGFPPHHGDNAVACLYHAARGDIRPAARQDELVRIATRAMAVDPGRRYPSVAAFAEALREYRTHRAAIALAARAEQNLAAAADSDDYDDYARSVFGFEEALRLWSRNGTALNGAAAARIAYAERALARGDFDLARSVATPLTGDVLAAAFRNAPPELRPAVHTRNHVWKSASQRADRLVAEADQQRTLAATRQRRERRLTWSLYALGILVTLGALAGFLWTARAVTEARAAAVRAEARAERAERTMAEPEQETSAGGRP